MHRRTELIVLQEQNAWSSMIVAVLFNDNRLPNRIDKRLDEDSALDQLAERVRRVLPIANSNQVSKSAI